jgi:hypothetical protein
MIFEDDQLQMSQETGRFCLEHVQDALMQGIIGKHYTGGVTGDVADDTETEMPPL